MDFEFNQSSTNCSSGPNKVRTAGDLLIEYAIDQGGSRADITARRWTGTAWGPALDLDVPSATCGGQPVRGRHDQHLADPGRGLRRTDH